MNIDYEDKFSILTMLDRLMIFKWLETLEGSTPVAPTKRFYENIRMDYMNYTDTCENLVLFFDHANVGEFQLEPEFLLEELEIKEGSYDGYIFLLYLEDLQRLKDLKAPDEIVDNFVKKIKSLFEQRDFVEWLDTTSTEVIEIAGIAMCYEPYYWHETVEALIKTIKEIRKECLNYENNCNN